MEIKKCLKATGYILQLATYILFLPLTAIVAYKNKCTISQRFCYAMCSHQVFRMLYMMLLAIGIATVNTLHIYLTHDYIGASMALAVSMPLLFDRIGHPLLQALRGSRQMMNLIMLIALTALFTPHMLIFAASLYILLVAASFYPSRRAIEKFQTLPRIHFYRKCPDTLVEEYFD